MSSENKSSVDDLFKSTNDELEILHQRLDYFFLEDIEKGKNSIWVTFSIDCDGLDYQEDGAEFNSLEVFKLKLPVGFPFKSPSLLFENSRPGLTHVLDDKVICLYMSDANDRDMSSGLKGIILRLYYWLNRAAKNELDPENIPEHPPYTEFKSPVKFQIDEDLGEISEDEWYGYAIGEKVNSRYLKISGWKKSLHNLPVEIKKSNYYVIPTFLTKNRFSHQVSKKGEELLSELLSLGFNKKQILSSIQRAYTISPKRDLCFLIGGLNRGVEGNKKYHIMGRRLFLEEQSKSEVDVIIKRKGASSKVIEEKVEEKLLQLIEEEKSHWVRVIENRPEIINSRDENFVLDNSLKKILLLGCGAIGSKVSTSIVRHSISKNSKIESLTIVDNDIVTEGILLRQDYNHSQLGMDKTEALKSNLDGINPTISIDAINKECVDYLSKINVSDFDLVIDSTASKLVRGFLELRKREEKFNLSTLFINENSDIGVVINSPSDYNFGAIDIWHKTTLNFLRDPSTTYLFEAFHNVDGRDPFIPEPGCSEPTFRGSNTHLSKLTGFMFEVIGNLSKEKSKKGSIDIFDTKLNFKPNRLHYNYTFENNRTIIEENHKYEVCVPPSVCNKIEGQILEDGLRYNRDVETGGYIWGHLDKSLNRIWIFRSIGAPSDTIRTKDTFVIGVNKLDKVDEKLSTISKYKLKHPNMEFLGSWHTHPDSDPKESERDKAACANAVKESLGIDPFYLSLIFSVDSSDSSILDTKAFLNLTSDYE